MIVSRSIFFFFVSFLGLSLNLTWSKGWSAPIPATSSSVLISSNFGFYISEFGFSLQTGPTSWTQSPPPQDIPSLVTFFVSPKSHYGLQPSLTVRVDEVKKELGLRQFVKQWIKDYSRLGLEIINSKPVKINGQLGYLIDTMNQDALKQLRQVVFLKNNTAVILTCRDHKETFDDSVKDCNEIIRTFQWIK